MTMQPSTIDISDLIEGDALIVAFDHELVPGATVRRRAVLRIETAGIVSMQHDESLPPMYPCTVLHGADVLGERVTVIIASRRAEMRRDCGASPVVGKVVDLISTRNVMLARLR
jgi:hypothetical protein